MNTHYQPSIETCGLRIYTDQQHIATAVLDHLAKAPFRPENSGEVLVVNKLIQWERIVPIEF